MTGICFFYEDSDTDVWSGKGFDAWNYACKVAGDIDSAIIINRTEETFSPFDVSMDIHVVDTLEEAEALMHGDSVASIVCPWEGGEHPPLDQLPHDSVDWYVFGPANGWGQRDGYSIPQAGQGSVHAVHACTVVMFHRYWTLNP